MRSHPLLVARLCDRHPVRAEVSTKTVLSSEYTNSANWYTNTQAPVVHTESGSAGGVGGRWAP